MFTQEQLAAIRSLPLDQQTQIRDLLSELGDTTEKETARSGFYAFVEATWPGFIGGRHHRIIADVFDRMIHGDLKRAIINMPPRHTKSEFGSIRLPAYALGHHPDWKIIQSTHTAELAVAFGRKVRDLINEEVYHKIFHDTELKADSKAAGRWNTSLGGEYFAIGVGGAIAGRGADLFIIDDPHDEQEALQARYDPKVFDKVYDWYTSGPRQRLQPGGRILIIQTRWGDRDLTGQVIDAMAARGEADLWEVIEFPMELPSGEPVWPEYWPKPEVEALKAELPAFKWNAQYQQNPTGEEGALIKREWWRVWTHRESPEVDYVIMAWDTAYSAKETADYSAMTCWGVFYRPNEDGETMPNLILLDAWRDRIEFPALKARVLEMWKDRQPDSFLIEGKASGMPLVFELRQMGIPVQEVVPVKGSRNDPNNKVARVNAISDLFASGIIWAPETRWAEEVIDECASFPLGANDDYVDTVVMSLMRYRHGGFLPMDTDERDEPKRFRKRADYY